MKKIYFAVLLIATSIQCFAQNNTLNQATLQINQKQIHIEVYRVSLKAGDYMTALNALNYLNVIERKSGIYKDSLAILYFSTGNYLQSLFWAEEILSVNPEKISILEIKAATLKKTNQTILAIEVYEKLKKIQNSPIYIFNLIESQYQIKRLLECLQNTSLIESLVYTNEMKFPYLSNEKKQVYTSLKAAMYNYQGLTYYDLGEKELAKIAFEKAVSIDTTFQLAVFNLQTVTKDLEKPHSEDTNSNSNNDNILIAPKRD
jgi:tetratricopeptide (TPR) repeat protein